MNGAHHRRRGRPLMSFAGLLTVWIGCRVLTFEAPWPTVVSPVSIPVAGLRSAVVMPAPVLPVVSAKVITSVPDVAAPPLTAAPERYTPPAPEQVATPAPPVESPPFALGRFAAGHNLAWMAAMASLPMPTAVAEALDRQGFGPTVPKPPRRWRTDGWLMLRQGSGRAILPGGQRAPIYGASQLGAVVAYRLAPTSRRLPTLYARASRALIDEGESEAALGGSLRPIPAVPFSAYAELRLTHGKGGTKLRPAAYIAGGAEQVDLPLGLKGRGYVQAGYVAGDFATGFIEGQAVADSEVARFDLGRVRAGAGTWGGAQKGAARVDVGPAAALDMIIADAPVRVAVDYRHRVAGNASPRSSGVLTLTTGF